jgi:hypothetical protein
VLGRVTLGSLLADADAKEAPGAVVADPGAVEGGVCAAVALHAAQPKTRATRTASARRIGT